MKFLLLCMMFHEKNKNKKDVLSVFLTRCFTIYLKIYWRYQYQTFYICEHEFLTRYKLGFYTSFEQKHDRYWICVYIPIALYTLVILVLTIYTNKKQFFILILQ